MLHLKEEQSNAKVLECSTNPMKAMKASVDSVNGQRAPFGNMVRRCFTSLKLKTVCIMGHLRLSVVGLQYTGPNDTHRVARKR